MRILLLVNLLLATLPAAAQESIRQLPKEKPYSLTQSSTITRSYADGLAATETHTISLARDSEGRSRTESEISRMNPTTYIQDGRVIHMTQHGPLHTVNIVDPAGQRFVSWSVGQGSHQVNIQSTLHFRPQPQRPPVAAEQEPQAELIADEHREKLGQRAIQGILADGTRTTIKYSAGVFGMNREFTVIREEWRATDYHVLVEQTLDDPREGKSVLTLTSFTEGAPDPALFEPPKGFTVIETKQVSDAAVSEKP